VVVWITWPDEEFNLPSLSELPLVGLKLSNPDDLFLFSNQGFQQFLVQEGSLEYQAGTSSFLEGPGGLPN